MNQPPTFVHAASDASLSAPIVNDNQGIQVPFDQWKPLAGKIWLWKVTAPAEATSPQAPVSAYPASYIQERHLRRALANEKLPTPPPSVWEAVSVDFDTPLNHEVLGEVWKNLLHRSDSLCSWFQCQEIPAVSPAGSALSKVTRHQIDPSSLTWELVEGPTFATGKEVREFLIEIFNEETSPLAWPGFIGAAVEAESGFQAIFAEDHSFCDGYSNLISIVEIRNSYTALISHTTPQLPAPGSQLESSLSERLRLSSLTLESPQIQRWIDYYRHSGRQLLDFPLPLGITDPQLDQCGGKVLTFELLNGSQADTFHAYCKQHGGGFAAGLYAAYAVVNFSVAGREDFNMLRAVSTRNSEEETFTHGWFINTIPIVFDLKGTTKFSDLVSRAQKAIDDAKDLTSVPIQRVIDLIAESTGETSSTGIPFQPPPMISYIDVRPFPEWLSQRTTPHRVIQPVPPTTTVFSWVNRYHDALEVVIYFPDTPLALESIQRYVAALIGTLKQVAETGELRLTPTPAEC